MRGAILAAALLASTPVAAFAPVLLDMRTAPRIDCDTGVTRALPRCIDAHEAMQLSLRLVFIPLLEDRWGLLNIVAGDAVWHEQSDGTVCFDDIMTVEGRDRFPASFWLVTPEGTVLYHRANGTYTRAATHQASPC